MLHRHDPRAGMRDLALPQESQLANRPVLQQQEIAGDDGDEMARGSKMDSGGIDVDLGAEDEDEDDPDYDPDFDEEVKGDHELPAQIDTDELLQGFLSSQELEELDYKDEDGQIIKYAWKYIGQSAAALEGAALPYMQNMVYRPTG